MRLSERFNIVPVIEPQDHQSAGIDGDSINAGKLHSLAFLISFGQLTANSILTLYSGATAGTKTTAETFNYRLADAVVRTATADTFGAWATSAALTLTAATYEDKLLIVEIDPASLTDGQPWVTVEIDNTASELLVSAVAVCTPRYAGHDVPTVIS